MLLKQDTLKAIKMGTVTLAFRRWKRPTVSAGGTLTTSVGVLDIVEVERVGLKDIAEEDAAQAGYARLDALISELNRSRARSVYRIALRFKGEDPRISLRKQLPGTEELDRIKTQLERWDKSSPSGPWTRDVLNLLRANPAVRAADLAPQVGLKKDKFKTNVRKMKGLGLTESLEVGYRLSARGSALLDEL